MNTIYFLNCVAGNLFKTKTSPALPNEYYLGLSTSAPDVNGDNVTEPLSSAGYKRVLLTDLSAPAAGLVTNTKQIEFEESIADWGRVTHFVVYDSEARGTGNLLMYGALSTPRSVETATIMTIKQGYLKLSAQNA